MNETLSDEEIKHFTYWCKERNYQKEDAYSYYQMQKALNTIEALKAVIADIEKSKDAQIKQLVEALEETKEVLHDEKMTWPAELVFAARDVFINTDKALSTMPDVEGYRLEREALELSKEMVNRFITGEGGLVYPIAEQVNATFKALEAHREKVTEKDYFHYEDPNR